MASFFKKFALEVDEMICKVRTPEARTADGYTISVNIGVCPGRTYMPITANPMHDLSSYYMAAIHELSNRLEHPVGANKQRFKVELYISYKLDREYGEMQPKCKSFFDKLESLFCKWFKIDITVSNTFCIETPEHYFDVVYMGPSKRFI